MSAAVLLWFLFSRSLFRHPRYLRSDGRVDEIRLTRGRPRRDVLLPRLSRPQSRHRSRRPCALSPETMEIRRDLAYDRARPSDFRRCLLYHELTPEAGLTIHFRWVDVVQGSFGELINRTPTKPLQFTTLFLARRTKLCRDPLDRYCPFAKTAWIFFVLDMASSGLPSRSTKSASFPA